MRTKSLSVYVSTALDETVGAKTALKCERKHPRRLLSQFNGILKIKIIGAPKESHRRRSLWVVDGSQSNHLKQQSLWSDRQFERKITIESRCTVLAKAWLPQVFRCSLTETQRTVAGVDNTVLHPNRGREDPPCLFAISYPCDNTAPALD